MKIFVISELYARVNIFKQIILFFLTIIKFLKVVFINMITMFVLLAICPILDLLKKR